MKLEEFETYNLAMALGEEVYAEVITWDYFNKDTIGKQMFDLQSLLLLISLIFW